MFGVSEPFAENALLPSAEVPPSPPLTLERLERLSLQSGGRSYFLDPMVPGRELLETTDTLQEIEAHYWVRDSLTGKVEHRSSRITESMLPELWEDGFGPFLHITGGVPHLFLTRPVEKEGRLLPGDSGLKSYATQPLVLEAEPPVEEIGFVLQDLVNAHREARAALNRQRSQMDRELRSGHPARSFSHPTGPAVAFVSDEDFPLFSELQLSLGARVRALATVRPTAPLLRWWGLGTVRFLAYGSPPRGQGWTGPFRDLATQIIDLFGRVPGAIVALTDLSLLGATAEELATFLGTLRAAAVRWHGHLLVHLSPTTFTEEERARILEDFEIRSPTSTPEARALAGKESLGGLPLAFSPWKLGEALSATSD